MQRNSIAKHYSSLRFSLNQRVVIPPLDAEDLQNTPNSLNVIARMLQTLDESALEEVQDMVRALLAVRQKPEPQQDTASLSEGPTDHRGVGHIEIKLIPDTARGKTYGPYRYLRYWSQGRLRTRYLGKV